VRQSTVQTSLALGTREKTKREESFAGTFDYAAPEQKGKLPGVKVGAYSDVYSFGKTFLEALFGTTELIPSEDWNEIDTNYREPLRRLLERCVVETPARRHGDFLVVQNNLKPLQEERERRESKIIRLMKKREIEEMERRRLANLQEQTAITLRNSDQEKKEEEKESRYYTASIIAFVICVYAIIRSLVISKTDAPEKPAMPVPQYSTQKQPRPIPIQYPSQKEPSPAPIQQPTQKEPRPVPTQQPTPKEPRSVPVLVGEPKIQMDDKKLVCSVGDLFEIELIKINAKGNKFLMGSPKEEAERHNDEEQHEVYFDYDFYMGKFEVTQEQYETIMGSNPSKFESKSHPVERVSWTDTQEFLGQLNERFKDRNLKFRLPSEAEWEYACRAGATTPFHFGSALNGMQANCDGTIPYGTETKGAYRKKTTTIIFSPNEFGLYDMHGNVWEWCEDYYGPYSKSPKNGTAQTDKQTNDIRVLRGGSWFSDPRDCRSADRSGNSPVLRYSSYGFRVVVSKD